MYGIHVLFTGLFLTFTTAQMPVQSFFNVPGTAFNRGGRVDFAGMSLGQICKNIMMVGGKEALSDGMGMAAKWFSNQRMTSQVAGGTDPQMQCLYSQATGGMMPGAVGMKDPGNMFGDYFDTVIEYPMIVDPCTAPQCDGKVNPTVLLMQAFAPMMRPGGMGGGVGGGVAPANPFGTIGQNPFLAAMMPAPSNVPTAPAAPVNATSGSATQPAAPAAVPPVPSGNPMNAMPNQNQMAQMLNQFLMQMFVPNQGQTATKPNLNLGFPTFPPFGKMFL